MTTGESIVRPTLSRDPLIVLRLNVRDAECLGQTARGELRRVEVAGGTFEGLRTSGIVLPGVDWQQIDQSGITLIDARYSLRTAAGELIEVNDRGLRFQGTVCAASPPRTWFRTTMRFSTQAPRLDWLNRMIGVGSGRRDAGQVVVVVHCVE